ncbi:MAG: Gfo/Idh/MocA family oxidoreductase [Acidobacteria bacterium]|nr:Gfo/Idh/MocA family oxidoreductase [Acidobacteriota bacterium]
MAPVLRFGIVGLGVASTQILPHMAKHPYAKVTAACDVNRPHALEKFRREFGGETFESIEDLCRSKNVDAVYICTANHLHKEHAIIAAEHKKHIIVEKPMALSIEDCEAMNQAVEKNGIKLLCGHTHSFDPPIQKMREIVRSGELGKLRQILTFYYNEFMYRPRMPQELNSSQGGNVVFNQGPHQVDIVRLIGGGRVRSLRAMTGIWDEQRRAEGAWAAYLEFEDGTPALMGYSGYGHFDTAELHFGIGEGGRPRDPETNLKARKNLQGVSQQEEAALKESMRYAGTREGEWLRGAKGDRPHQSFFGFTLVSCEKGDIRQSPNGLTIYGDSGKEEIPLPPARTGREAEIDELYRAVVEDRPVFHDGRWGEATLEVVLAIMESARQRKEIFMSHQVPGPD